MFQGENEVQEIYYGDGQVKEAYLGETLVYTTYDDYYTVPAIISVEIAPNPADAGATISIEVKAKEVSKGISKVYFYSGEIYSGEEY